MGRKNEGKSRKNYCESLDMMTVNLFMKLLLHMATEDLSYRRGQVTFPQASHDATQLVAYQC